MCVCFRWMTMIVIFGVLRDMIPICLEEGEEEEGEWLRRSLLP